MANVSVGAEVLAADYNQRRDIVDSLYDATWLQSKVSADVTANVDEITSEQMEELFIDLQSMYQHQSGGLYTNLAVPAVGFTIGADTVNDYNPATGAFTAVTGGTFMGYNDYEACKNAIEGYTTDHLSYDASSFSLENTASAQRTTNWGNSANTDDIYHVVDVDWSSVAFRNAWLAANGRIHFTASITGASGSKSLDWQSMLSGMGTVYVDKYNTSATSGTSSSIGIQNLTSSYQQMFQKTGSGVYADNNYTIYGKTNGNGYRFRIRFFDGDTGTGDLGGVGTGTPIDEPVNGTLNSGVSTYSPDSSFNYNAVTYVACDLSGATKGGQMSNASSNTQNNLGNYNGTGLL